MTRVCHQNTHECTLIIEMSNQLSRHTAITKMDILYMFYHFQDPIKVIRRYEGCHYTRLESYYIIFYFETDWSRIRPLPSTTLIN